MSDAEKLTAVDVFSGCGGMTYGLKQAGFKVLGALEFDPVAAATYRLNHGSVNVKESDIKNVDGRKWMRELGVKREELDLLAGCPPCQGFSSLRTFNGGVLNKDRRNRLIMEMARLIGDFMPKAVMMENVPGLAEKTVFKEFIRFLRRTGYEPVWDVKDVRKYGVPQRRRRLILLAGYGFEIPFGNEARKEKTVRMAIGKLKQAGKSNDRLHDIKEERTPEMKKWIAMVPKNGGSRTDLPKSMQRPCHQKTEGFKDVYGRMAWDNVSPTITGGCLNPSKGRFLHPVKNRNITIREAALLQSFPKRFKLIPGTTKNQAALMIGNALPPEFVRRHGLSISRTLQKLIGEKRNGCQGCQGTAFNQSNKKAGRRS